MRDTAMDKTRVALLPSTQHKLTCIPVTRTNHFEWIFHNKFFKFILKYGNVQVVWKFKAMVSDKYIIDKLNVYAYNN